MKKLHKNKGFTLVETLAALIILVMLTLVVNTGVQVAVKTYRTLTFASESDLLSSTIYTSLSDVLRFAKWEKTEAGDADGSDPIIYITNEYYSMKTGHLLILDGKLAVNPEAAEGGTEGTADSDTEKYYYLVNSGAYTNLKLTDFTIEYQDGVFSGTYTIENKSGDMKKEANYTFRSLRPGAVTAEASD